VIYTLQSESGRTQTNTSLGILPSGIAPDKDPPALNLFTPTFYFLISKGKYKI